MQKNNCQNIILSNENPSEKEIEIKDINICDGHNILNKRKSINSWINKIFLISHFLNTYYSKTNLDIFHTSFNPQVLNKKNNYDWSSVYSTYQKNRSHSSTKKTIGQKYLAQRKIISNKLGIIPTIRAQTHFKVQTLNINTPKFKKYPPQLKKPISQERKKKNNSPKENIINKKHKLQLLKKKLEELRLSTS